MSTKIIRRRPETPLNVMLHQRPSDSDTTEKGVDKRSTILGIADAEQKDATGGLITQQLFVPNEEQLAKINTFTRRSVSADEVACFTTHSCNDLPDRDDDRFVTRAVSGFAALPPPYSPTGKAYMVGHDYSKSAVGRIFDTGTKSVTIDGSRVTFLTNDVYIPRIAANETFIQNMEFGVNWAVSVGVMLGKSTCQVGKEHGWGFWFFCSRGHEKGLWYDPDSDEEDEWGYPIPVQEGSKNAVKCIRDLDDAKDMYELSSVFLGAQYYAEISKRPDFAGVVKAASARHIPVIGLKRQESKALPLPQLPTRLRDAVKNHSVEEAEDGTFTWVDENRLVWSFLPGSDVEPACLGRSAQQSDKTVANKQRLAEVVSKFEKAKAEKDVAGAGAFASQLSSTIDELRDAIENDDDETQETLIDRAEDLIDSLLDELYENDDDEEDDNQNPEGKTVGDEKMSKKTVMGALTKIRLPQEAVEAISRAPEDSAFEVFVNQVSKAMQEQATRANAGDQYLKDLRAELVELYVKVNTTPGEANGRVDVGPIEKILGYIEHDPDALKALRDEYLKAMQSKFPASVRRSTVENDQNAIGSAVVDLSQDLENRVDTSMAKKIHG